MIVYNVQKKFFAKKEDAETYRKMFGLKPEATYKVEVQGRDDLAALLNTLTGLSIDFEPTISDEAKNSVPDGIDGLELVWERFRSIKT